MPPFRLRVRLTWKPDLPPLFHRGGISVGAAGEQPAALIKMNNRNGKGQECVLSSSGITMENDKATSKAGQISINHRFLYFFVCCLQTYATHSYIYIFNQSTVSFSTNLPFYFFVLSIFPPFTKDGCKHCAI
jgi:hypothetical protein